MTIRILAGATFAAVLAATALTVAGLAIAQVETPGLPQTYGNLLTPVFTGHETIIGQPIAFSTEPNPLVTSAIVTIPPGGETGWHEHSVPLFVYILEGAVTVDYGSHGIRTISAGSSILEAMNWPHNAHNYGSVPVRILAVYLGAEGVANATEAAGPR
jgi:quercetin dioxygenase-like cupin family protein